MAMIDDIVGQLSQLGIDTQGFSGLSQLGPQQIATALQGQFGLSGSQLPSSLFQPISEELIKGSLASTYSPQVQATGQTLVDKMLQSGQGQMGRQAAGGFAGSGQQQQFASGIKDVYGKGMTDVLTKTGQQRTQSLSSIQDLINQWRSQAMQIKGYQ